MGFIFGFIGCALFLFAIWTGDRIPESRDYIILIFSFFVGITVGFFVYSLARIGLMITGTVLGIFIGIILYNAYLHNIISQPVEVYFIFYHLADFLSFFDNFWTFWNDFWI